MIESEHIIRLDINNSSYQRDLSIMRNDTCRTLIIKLYENGKPFIIPENCKAQFVARKRDNTSIFNDCAIEDNCIVYELTTQTTAASGSVYCEIRLNDENNELITSPKFSLFVEPSVFVEGGVEEASGDQIDALSNLRFTLEDSYDSGKFNGKPGIGIKKIEQAVASNEDNGTNIIRITLEDGTFTDVVIKNGSSGPAGAEPIILSVPTLIQGADDYTEADKAAVQAVIDAVSASENPVVMLRSGTTLIPSAYYKQSATHYFVGINPDSFPGDGGEVWFTYVKFNSTSGKLTVNEHANIGADGEWLEDISDLEADFNIPTNNLIYRAITLALEGFEGGNGVGIESVKQTVTSNESYGQNVFVITLTDGTQTPIIIRNGQKGAKGDKGDTGTDGKSAYAYAQDSGYTGTEAEFAANLAREVPETISLGIASDGLMYVFINGNPVGTGIPQGQSGDVFGYVDENNTVVLSGNLPDGTYTIKYEMEDGTTKEIGDLTLGYVPVYYSVSNNLTLCTTNSNITRLEEGSSYSAKITANSGYQLSSVKVVMGGVDITSSAVSGGNINIASITGNVVITAVATEIVVSYQQVAYIENTDQNSYVDLGYTNTDNTGIKITFELASAATSIGATGIMGNNDLAIGHASMNTADLRAYWGGVKSYQLMVNTATGNEYIVGVNYCGSGKTNINGTDKAWNSGTKSFVKNNTITLCKQNGYKNFGQNGLIKIKEVYISEGSSVSKHYVPAYRSTDGKIGMLETNSNTFIPATGTFTKGADV